MLCRMLSEESIAIEKAAENPNTRCKLEGCGVKTVGVLMLKRMLAG
jgi:hypothetical protein